jgi:hypothetical protein
MKAQRKRMLMIASIVVIVIVTVLFSTFLLFNINSYKTMIETAVSQTTGFDFKINGKMRLSFIPLGLSVNDIKVTNKGENLLTLERLKIRAELIPLLKKRLKITTCKLIKPTVYIIKDEKGNYNFESINHIKESQGTASGWKNISILKGALVYLDKKSGDKTELKGINLTITDLSIADTTGGIVKSLSFAGALDCEEVVQKDLRIGNLKASMKMGKGVFSLKPLTMDVFDGKGEGEVMIDETAVDPVYKFKVMVSNLNFERLEEFFDTKKIIGGKGGLSATLIVKDKKGRPLISNLDGVFALRGDNLITHTMDLDKVLSKYETAQKFHPADLAVFFVVGPLGNIVLKEYRYQDLFNQTRSGQGDITQFISHWTIRSGEAEALDCALATRHNRVALRGKLNLVSNQYDSVTVALLNDAGCAAFKQTLNGSFAGPRTGPVSMVESLASPLFDLYRKVKRFVRPVPCKVFYDGAVRQPH